MVSSMSAVRTVSTLTSEVSTFLSWTAARVMRPVSPMPPAVAQNNSGSPSGVTVFNSPEGSSRLSSRTWRAKLPAT